MNPGFVRRARPEVAKIANIATYPLGEVAT